MIKRYSVFLHLDVTETLRSLAEFERDLVLCLVHSLANDPFQSGDLQEPDEDGRINEIKIVGRQADHKRCAIIPIMGAAAENALVGRIGKADTLVRDLISVNRALGLRAVATAQGLSEETLGEVLELTDEWEERRDVYLKIPGLLDDAERSLALIDRLRRQRTNGNDLFFLDAAIGEV